MTAAAVVTASPDSGQSAHLREGLKAFLVLAAFTLLTRGWIFGNPVVNMDEQFYLLVGERMWQGGLPYVDIWDRKPVGLFLIYALAARLFPDPVIGYQLLATLAVMLTAQLIFTVARRLTSFSSALAAAAAYPAWLLVFGGIGGQSPVFYNLPMAIAAVWTMAKFTSADEHRLTRHGCAIMLLVGVAIQIKYTALFEGIFFGLSLLWTGWQHGRSLTRLAGDGAIWIAAALAATLAAWGAYAAIGQSEAFVQANFLSVIADANPFLPALGRLAGLLFGLSPLYVCIWFAWRHWHGRQGTAARQVRWLLAWATASLVGFLAFGVWNDHYVLPMLTPLCLLVGLGFEHIGKRSLAMALVIGLGWVGGTGRAYVEWRISGTEAQAQRLLAMVQPHLAAGCLYVNEDLPYLYRLTRSCLPTRYAFPQHLALWRYEHGLGIDQMGELRHLLASRPTVIVMSEVPDVETRFPTRDAVQAVLKQAYVKVGTTPIGEIPFTVYALAGPEHR